MKASVNANPGGGPLIGSGDTMAFMATVSEAPGISAIEADLPCAICGYNLKGLSPAGTCPECGQAISRTFRFDLTDADPGWLMSQAWTVAAGAVPAEFSAGGFALYAVAGVRL
jgi:hypothetical protein